MPPRGPKAPAKPKNFGKSLRKLIGSLGYLRIPIIIALVLAAAGTVITILGPKLLGDIINIVVEDTIARFTDPSYVYRYDQMGGVCLTLIILFLIATIMSYISGWIIVNVTQKVVKKFRRDISEKINHLPIAYFDSHQYGDTLSRVTNDIDTIAQSLNQSISQFISSITLFIGILIMMFTISWQLSLIALATIPLSALSVGFITARSQKYFKAQQEELGTINGHIEETYSGQTIIKAFSAEAKTTADFRAINQRLHASAWKSQFISGLMWPLTNFIERLGFVAIAIVGGILAIRGHLGIGDISAFIQYMDEFTQPIAQLAQIMTTLQSAVAASERVFEFLEEPEEPDVLDKASGQESPIGSAGLSDEPTVKDTTLHARESNLRSSESLTSVVSLTDGARRHKPAEPIGDSCAEKLSGMGGLGDPANKTVVFDKVKFGYTPDQLVIKGFSAEIKPGMTVAIVGPTGAGKTTLVNLLMRFYDPTSGTITIGGTDTTTVPRAQVRRLFGMVLQDTWLFQGSIMDNLRYGCANATEEDVKAAARSAHIAHTIESLPSSYNTRIDEDSEAISAGEKQLLTIARAFVADPPMIILDEATSSVDTRTEHLIQKAMEKLTKGRTSFVIAHRLSTIKNADLILVMRDGNIVEQGTHAQLLKAQGFYASLYNSQFTDID